MQPTGTQQRWLAPLLGLSLAAGSGVSPQTAVATGAIEGEVTYEGEAPPPTIVMEGGGTQRVLYVGSGGALRFAVAFLAGSLDGGAPTEDPATLDQVGFIFQPPVLAVREGQIVRFTNEDGANHTVRSHHGHPSNRFNIYTGAGQEGTQRFKATAGAPAVITCDIHPWMIAWIYAFTHPYFAVTGESGRFRISGVPPGRYQLAVRQPSGGLERDLPVRVSAGEVSRVTVRFAATEVRLPRRPDTDGQQPRVRSQSAHAKGSQLGRSFTWMGLQRCLGVRTSRPRVTAGGSRALPSRRPGARATRPSRRRCGRAG